MSSEQGRGSLRKTIALRSSVIALWASENSVGVAESLPSLFGGVGYWMKSMMLSFGDGRRMLEMAAGIPAIVGSRVDCLATGLAEYMYLFIYFLFIFKDHVIYPRAS